MKVITRSYKSITKSYGVITRSYRRWGKRDWTIGLDWLGIGWREGWRGGWRMAAGIIFLAWPSPHPSPHPSPS